MTFRSILVIDAKDHIVGKLSAAVCKELLMGQKVVIVRAEEAVKVGPLYRIKAIYADFRRKRTLTNPKKGPFHHREPSKMLYRVIRGMLPYKTKRGEEALQRLEIYEGVPFRFQKRKRVYVSCAMKSTQVASDTKVVSLGRLASEFGWKKQAVIAKLESKRKEQGAEYHQHKAKIQSLRNEASDKAAKDAEFKKISQELEAFGY